DSSDGRAAQPRRHGTCGRLRVAAPRPDRPHLAGRPLRPLPRAGRAGGHHRCRHRERPRPRGRYPSLHRRAGRRDGCGERRGGGAPGARRIASLCRLQRDRSTNGALDWGDDRRRRWSVRRRRDHRSPSDPAGHKVLRLRGGRGGTCDPGQFRARCPPARRRDRAGLRSQDVLRRDDQGAPGARHRAAGGGPADGAGRSVGGGTARDDRGRPRLDRALDPDDAIQGAPLGRRDGGDCRLLRGSGHDAGNPERRSGDVPVHRRDTDRQGIAV
ncbi:MAG: 3-hydroxyisobutyrate dehydrogenase and related beta-hydroxyacid dehydrogenases, partial [uncultured Thermomicrobiales bacterium]